MAGCGANGSSAAVPQRASPAVSDAAVPTGGASSSERQLDQLFRSSEPKAEWFSPQFLQKVTTDQVRAVLERVRSKIGAYRTVSGAGDDYVAVFDHGTVKTHARLDDQGRFAGLFLEPPQKAPDGAAYPNQGQ